ncbi:13988_t:CDS:2 [Funneliformis geosporum]|uniref:13988_t:CDS:1 n=1 Tax=Funneliformis geosporum TaxID=1117311 RepID=A0A9W4T260_9GLOM|nr:13988_t:CDS:2 [Funneliformis geosporum]
MNYRKLHFFFALSHLFFSVEPFTPAERYSHTSALVENKLYFLGGDGEFYSNEVFYLDLSQQFYAEYPSWTDLTANSGMSIKSSWAAAALTINDNNPTVYLVGGIMYNQNNEDSFTSLVYAFIPKSGQWNKPVIKGTEPARRRQFQIAADDFGNIYVFGGGADKYVGSQNLQVFNDMAILNTADLTWSYGPIVNAPSPRGGHSATLISNGVIVYIGG